MWSGEIALSVHCRTFWHEVFWMISSESKITVSIFLIPLLCTHVWRRLCTALSLSEWLVLRTPRFISSLEATMPVTFSQFLHTSAVTHFHVFHCPPACEERSARNPSACPNVRSKCDAQNFWGCRWAPQSRRLKAVQTNNFLVFPMFSFFARGSRLQYALIVFNVFAPITNRQNQLKTWARDGHPLPYKMFHCFLRFWSILKLETLRNVQS